MDAGDRAAQIEQAFLDLEDGDLEAAAALASQLEGHEDSDPEAFALQIEVALAREQDPQAFELAERGLKECGRQPLLLAHRARLLLDVLDDPLGGREDLEAALASSLEPELEADLQMMLAEACLRMQDAVPALAAAERGASLFADDPEPHALAGQALLDLHRFDEALKAVARAVDRDPHHAPAYFTRGEILEAQGDLEGAEKAFARARQIDPEGYPELPQVPAEAFEQLVAEAIDGLPEVVASYLHNVAIVVDEHPDLETLKLSEPPLSPACLGLFEGTPRPLESVGDPWSTLPKAVRLYRRNILRACASEEQVADVIATTLLHEIGHFLGLDEEDLLERGLQ